MKTVKLLTLFLSVVLFLSVWFTTASAEITKCGVGKYASEMKVSKEKIESMKLGSKKNDANKMTPKVYDDTGWKKNDSEVEYPRGAISTH